eukprot:TRINITY_DN4489_c0_g1_i1.p1 TRINITY_DN4489_c0_g1~~TRINITY_DN4489_c0_g1_i1.p1  ORF type:complete len:307 (-),score=72.04 TRINITY_DN4489_c0_g1_i1:21-917(-)
MASVRVEIAPDAIVHRTVALLRLRVDSEWQQAQGLTRCDVWRAGVGARCCDPANLHEVKCLKCGGVVKVEPARRAGRAATLEDYDFDLSGICTSSTMHMGGDVVLVFDQLPKLPAGPIVSQPFKLLSKPPKGNPWANRKRGRSGSGARHSTVKATANAETILSMSLSPRMNPQSVVLLPSPLSSPSTIYSNHFSTGIFCRVRLLQMDLSPELQELVTQHALNVGQHTVALEPGALLQHKTVVTPDGRGFHLYLGMYYSRGMTDMMNNMFVVLFDGANPLKQNLLTTGRVAPVYVFENF